MHQVGFPVAKSLTKPGNIWEKIAGAQCNQRGISTGAVILTPGQSPPHVLRAPTLIILSFNTAD